jgi:short-subunit dehydrogenase
MPTALVTGASTGIGRDLARLCASAGYDMVLVARNQAQLSELAAQLPGKTRVLARDLTDADTPAEIFREVGDVDVLVNNAGAGMAGLFHELDTGAQIRMLQLNVVALTHLTRLFLTGMVARRNGRILNVASTAAFQAGPLMAVYYATKAYVLSLSEALHDELRDRRVTVTCLCPGPTRTEFDKRADISNTGLFQGSNVMDSMTVARAGFDGMMAGKSVVIPGAFNTAGALLTRLVPRMTAARLARKLQETR